MLVSTSRKSEASCAVCKTCGATIYPSLYWGLRSSVWLHSDGMGHKKFRWYNFAS